MLELGGITQVQEEVRDIWLTRWTRDFVYDLRFSLRSFYRSPAFTVTAVLSLMLGIGATTAIYSLVDQVLLHALPVRAAGAARPDRLEGRSSRATGSAVGISCRIRSAAIWTSRSNFSKASFAAPLTHCQPHDGRRRSTRDGGGRIRQLLFECSASARIRDGVLASEDDGAPNANPVVVLSYDFWKTKLGGASNVVGRKLLVNSHPMTVIGVAAETFRGIDVGEVPSHLDSRLDVESGDTGLQRSI